MKSLLGVISIALIVGGLAACGSSNSSDMASDTTTTASQGPSESSQGGATTQSQSSTQIKSTQEQQGSQHPQSHSGSPSVATPLKVSGGGSAQYRHKGGDNSIQEFGEESDESELDAAAGALHSFYVARSEEDWSRACSYLSATMQHQLKLLASRSPRLKGRACAPILHAFTRPLPPSVRRELTVVDAGSLRTEGDQSFLIYRGEGRLAYAIPMQEEDGAWRVGLLAATPLE